jgi:hypothetical protein
MKKLASSPERAELELLKGMLANAGIQCEVRNGEVSAVIPSPAFYEELWVSDEDYPRAAELYASLQRPDPAPPGTWICPECGERVEAQFTSCWKCGAQRGMLA